MKRKRKSCFENVKERPQKQIVGQILKIVLKLRTNLSSLIINFRDEYDILRSAFLSFSLYKVKLYELKWLCLLRSCILNQVVSYIYLLKSQSQYKYIIANSFDKSKKFLTSKHSNSILCSLEEISFPIDKSSFKAYTFTFRSTTRANSTMEKVS